MGGRDGKSNLLTCYFMTVNRVFFAGEVFPVKDLDLFPWLYLIKDLH